MIRRLEYDRPVAVIGDIHGEASLLESLLVALGPDIPILVLGDLIDRGPDSKRVLDLLVSRKATGVFGNHDTWFMAWAGGYGFDTFALSQVMGGKATLKSYGIESTSPGTIEAERYKVPASHVEFLGKLSLIIDLRVVGQRYWMMHAGLASIPLEVDGRDDDTILWHIASHCPANLLWSGAEPAAIKRLTHPIIMGHMQQFGGPKDKGHVIAVDTGCGSPGGSLTAVVLPERRFVTVR